MQSKTGVKVKLIGTDGNVFALMGKVVKELRRAKVSEEVITEYLDEAKAGDYNHFLATTMSYVDVE